jgi:hypothetical protein
MIPIPGNQSLGIAGAEEETADTVNFLHRTLALAREFTHFGPPPRQPPVSEPYCLAG